MKLDLPGKRSQPDPYVIKEDGKYYMYATHVEGVQLYVSGDKLHWEFAGFCYVREGYKEYWAPAVAYIDGKYYLYVSCMPADSADDHSQRLIVAVSETPQGPFAYCRDLVPPFSIDAHAVQSGGEWFLFYSTNDYNAACAGTLVVVDKMLSPTQVCGHPKAVVRPTMEEEIFMRDRFEKGKDWYTVEGAFYFRKGDWHYITYSGNCYKSPYYYIGYARARTAETDLTKIDFVKYPSDLEYRPLLCRNEKESGTGHNCILEEDGRYYMFYHGRDNDADGEAGAETRTCRMCEISAENGVLTVTAR